MALPAPPKPSGGGSSSNMLPLIIIVVIALALFSSGDFNSAGGSRGDKNTGNSYFLFEITPSMQDGRIGDTTEFVLHYENKSNRGLKDARIRVIPPDGAALEQGETEYLLGDLRPGEKGEVEFALQLKETKDENYAPRTATAIAIWSEEKGSSDRSQAVVQARVLLAEAKEQKKSQSTSTLASAQNIAVSSRVGLVLVGAFLIFLAWYIFSLLKKPTDTTEETKIVKMPELREKTKKKERGKEKEKSVVFQEEEEVVIIKNNTKGAPPDNLPI